MNPEEEFSCHLMVFVNGGDADQIIKNIYVHLAKPKGIFFHNF